MAGYEEAVRAMHDPAFDPSLAVREGGERLDPPHGGRVRWLRYEPEQLTLEVETPRAAALVITDSYRSGWTATVDGLDAEILPAFVAFRSVTVPAGSHRVELRYRSPGLKAGVLVSLVTLVFVVWLLRKKDRTTAQA